MPHTDASGPHSSPPPPLRHSDQCLVDYYLYGYCDHTTLPRPKVPGAARRALTDAELADLVAYVTADHTSARATRTPRARYTRTVLSYIGFGCLVLTTYLIARHTDFLEGALIVGLAGLGWLFVLTCGLPWPVHDFLFADIRKVLPPDARERLDG